MPIPKSTYYNNRYRQGPALIRARQPFLIKNILTGTAIFSFAIGVYVFTLKAVSQDDFDDLPMPPPPAQTATTATPAPAQQAGKR
ncbi:hypothetical protein K402DRAFT_416539 [Aulographum hederae CBS 113979]|uniref:Cytochrome c oxidase assembly factor 3 n=1 Tax=Aulographum hederae CBS 113979 TaxID=1176131 RepID=A0A6G1HFP6_9PEZI|nr:hypothetical protein K402DRAFT_416539 [Aulographum hederae CBS 113979]